MKIGRSKKLHCEREVFIALCKLLSHDGFARKDAAFVSDGKWDNIVELANRHRVSPALWQSASAKGAAEALPSSVARSLENAFNLNGKRNKVIIRQFTEAVSLLNEHAIVPVVLKTLVNMLEAEPKELGMWTTRDIDLLVQRSDFSRAARILEQYRYVPKAAFSALMHSYPALYRPGELVGIDLHRDLGPQRMLLASEEALAESTAVKILGCEVRVLIPTHRLLHLLYHDEIQDRRFELGRISLHQLLNFRYLVDRFDQQIDWPQVEQRLRTAGFPSLMPSYCYMAEQLLGIRSASFPRVSWRAKIHYQRCLGQMEYPTLQSLMTVWETMTPPAVSKKDIEYMAGDTGWTGRLKYRAAFVRDVWKRNGLSILRKIRVLQKLRVQRR